MARRKSGDAQGDILSGTLDMLVLRTLLFGPAHGHTIAHAIEHTSDAVLQVEHGSLYPALHRLERDGLVKRTVFPVVPPRVEYELTALGQSLREPVTQLANWAKAHLAELDAARAAFDGREALAHPPADEKHEWSAQGRLGGSAHGAGAQRR